MRYAILLAVASLAARPAAAQVILNPVQIRPFAGAFVPLGDHSLEAAPALGAAVSRDLTHHVALVGTAWWAPSQAVSADAGVELRPGFAYRGRNPLYAFAGAGAGIRAADGDTGPAGYVAGGAQFDFGNMGARLESRAYATDTDGDLQADLLASLSFSWRL